MDFISCDLDQELGKQLFQIAHLIDYANKNNKDIVFKKNVDNELFTSLFNNKFNLLTEQQYDESNVYILDHLPLTFDSFSKKTRTKMQYLIYTNEDYMYKAYQMYNDIKKFFDCEDDDKYVAIYCNDNNKYEAFIQEAYKEIGVKNIVNFGDSTHSLEEYKVECDNKYIKLILMSFFKYHICTEMYESEWAAFISNYNDKKILKY